MQQFVTGLRARAVDDRELAIVGVSSLVIVLLLEGIGGAGAELLFGSWLSRILVVLILVMFWVGLILVPVSVLRHRIDLPVRVARWAPVVLPGLLIAPVLLLGAIGVDVSNADGPVLVSAVDHVWGNGTPYWLLESQDAPAPHLLYGVPLYLGASTDRLVLLPALATAALALWVARQVHARTGAIDISALAALSVLVLPPMFAQASRLPLYPVFTFAGLIGLAGLVRWINADASMVTLAGAALAIAVAVASHGAGLYFAPMAFLTIVFVTDRGRLRRWFVAMVAVGTANLPWLIAHLWISGLTRVSTPRDSWFLTNGHLLNVNESYWNLPVGSRIETLSNLPSLFIGATGALFLPIMLLGLAGLRRLESRTRWYVISGWVVLWAPLTLSRSAGFVRYYYPVLPAVIVLCGLGAHSLLSRVTDVRRRSVVVLVGLALLGLQLRDVVQTSVHGRLRGDSFVAEMRLAAEAIDDDDGVIGYRSFFLNLADPRIDTYAHDVLDEDEYVAFYRWDRAGLSELAEENQIGWVMLLRPTDRWEQRYNDAWLQPAFGERAQHIERLRAADCLVAEGSEFELYDLDRCLGDAASETP